LVKVQHLLEAVGQWAPWELTESWDHTGLQLGQHGQPVKRIMVALDLNEAVIREGLAEKVDGFILHHPLIFKPLTQISTDNGLGRALTLLIKNDLFVIAAHTNADKAAGGLNQYLADLLGLTHVKTLEEAVTESCKIVVFTPTDAVTRIRTAMAEAGAGNIGAYSGCAFQNSGTGIFQADIIAHPRIGEPGQMTETAEVRLEMMAPIRDVARIVQAVKMNHPYEEPAIDIYPLLNKAGHGLGRIGNLPKPVTLTAFQQEVKEKLTAKT
jgi:dinuclear metal center YbgI/SA1388 family protein